MKVDENALGLHDKFNYELAQGMQPRTLLESGQYKSNGTSSQTNIVRKAHLTKGPLAVKERRPSAARRVK